MKREPLSIYNDNFELIGQSDYNTVHKKGMWHQVIHCWIIDSNTHSIIYQKRNKTKIIYPNMLDVSVAGHCRVNEKPEETVCREAFEELGIEIESTKLLKLGIRRDAFSTSQKINREFQHVFLYETKINADMIEIENNELQYIVLLKPNDVLNAIGEKVIISGKKIINNSISKTDVSFAEFIPSIDNYNIKIPLTIEKYLKGERKIYF